MLELAVQMRALKFESDKLMPLIGVPARGERLVADPVVTGSARSITAAALVLSTDCSVSVEVQAKLDAVLMKGPSPVERLGGAKVMPFDGHTELLDIPEQRTPATGHFAPRRP